jgi:hypothetical protein
VDAVVEAYGGAKAVRAVRSYRLDGTVDARDRGERGEVTRAVVASSALTVFVRYPSTSEVRVVDGDVGRRGTTFADLVPVQGPLLGSMMVQAARANLPWLLDARRSELRQAAPDTAGTTLELSLREGLRLFATVDARTHLITRTVGEVSAGPTVVRFQTDLSDFRLVDGVRFAFHEENFASGRHTGTTTVTRIVVNPPPGMLDLRGGR